LSSIKADWYPLSRSFATRKIRRDKNEHREGKEDTGAAAVERGTIRRQCSLS
jgi:hypothetical protein